MKTDESAFVDANILVYAALSNDPRYDIAHSLLRHPGQALVISPQIIVEFYSTITNTKRVNTPFTPNEAIQFIEVLLSYKHITVVPISADVSVRMVRLLKMNPVKGHKVFDMQIAATMMVHGVTTLYTYNLADFRDVPGVIATEPS